MNRDKLIEKIVYMIFDTEVDLNDPTQTIQQIKELLEDIKYISEQE